MQILTFEIPLKLTPMNFEFSLKFPSNPISSESSASFKMKSAIFCQLN